MRRFNEAQIRWISRVPETSTQAKAVVEAAATRTEWHDSADGQTRLYYPNDDVAPRAGAALVIVRTSQAEARVQAMLRRKARENRAHVETKASSICPTNTLPASLMRRAPWHAS